MTSAKICLHHHRLIKACFRETETPGLQSTKEKTISAKNDRKGKRNFQKPRGKERKGGEQTDEPPNVLRQLNFILASSHLKDSRDKFSGELVSGKVGVFFKVSSAALPGDVTELKLTLH